MHPRERSVRHMRHIATRLRIAEWDGTPIDEFDDGSKITRARITLSEPADGWRAEASSR